MSNPAYYKVPLFNCAQWTVKYGESYGDMFCTAEKALDIFSAFISVVLVYQLDLSIRQLHLKWNDYRTMIFLLALVSSLNMFVHYGLIPPAYRG